MNINYPKNLPLIKIPQKEEFTIFLIREELKSRKLTMDLNKIGFESSICISDFSHLIFSAIGFDNNSDVLYEWYILQLDKFCKEIDLTDDVSISEAAFNFYILLRSK